MTYSGRGRSGRNGRGRSGGRGRGNGGRFTSKQPKPKLKLEDHVYYIGTSKQATDYETNTQFIINHIKKTYEKGGEDIAEALEDLEHINLKSQAPKLQSSTATDPAVNERENKQYEIDYKEDKARHTSRVETYKSNKTRAYGLIWERCHTNMKNQIEERDDFKTVIRNDPVELLKAIKQHALNYQEHRYDMAIIADSMKTWINCKQRDGESLTAFTKRYRTATEVMESHIGGPIPIPKFVEKMDGYDKDDADKVQKLVKVAFEQLSSYVYMDNSDQSKYGSYDHC
jgi:hypothetical protein